MKGRFFGYEQIDPCPHCGTPRVLADWDDDCYVIPGLLQPKVPATCNVVFEYRGGRWWLCPTARIGWWDKWWMSNPP